MLQLTDHLARRSRTDGSAPFLTHYSPAGRTELSVRSFANWVDKTANLIVDEFELAEGERVCLRLAEEHPGHWMTLVWAMACWRAGVRITDAAAELTVIGPAAAETTGPTISCSLHPLALPQRDLPAGVRDFSTEALAQPDAWLGADPDPATPAVDLAEHRATLAELAGLADLEPIGGRLLLADPPSLWVALLEGLIQPLPTGSRVIAEGIATAELTRITASEKVERP